MSDHNEDNSYTDLVRAIVIAGLIALTFRTFAYEPFSIPSESMLPTLEVGDYLFVSKHSYGYSRYSFPFGLASFEGRFAEDRPKRGDVAVFRLPTNPNIDFIKRIIGLPGDRIQMKLGILHINDQPVPRVFDGTVQVSDKHGRFLLMNRYKQTLPGGVTHKVYELSDVEPNDDTGVYVVPQNHYFAMGDNRDESLDSRVLNEVGFVPAENLIGRADVLFFSIERADNRCDQSGTLEHGRRLLCRIATIPLRIRYERLFRSIYEL